MDYRARIVALKAQILEDGLLRKADKYEVLATCCLIAVLFATIGFSFGLKEVLDHGRSLFFPGFEWMMLGIIFACLVIAIISASQNMRFGGKPAKFWYLFIGILVGIAILTTLMAIFLMGECSSQDCYSDWGGGGGGIFVLLFSSSFGL
jgi:hypothetical protein